MAVEKLEGRCQVYCDHPGCVAAASDLAWRGDEWDAMIAEARAKGWQIVREAGRWVHRCPDHAAQAALL